MSDSDDIGYQLRSINSNIKGFGFGNALNRMKGSDAVGWLVIGAIFLPCYLVWRIYKAVRDKRREVIAREEEMLIEEARQRVIGNEASLSRRYAMSILDEIKKEEYEKEDPLYAPVKGDYQGLTTEQIGVIKAIMEGSYENRLLRGALRWLLALPQDRAKEELINIKTELAMKNYSAEYGDPMFSDPKALQKLRRRFEGVK